MITNGIEIPDAGSTREYIADKIGGWVYVITTTVVVEQKRLDGFNQEIADAQKAVEEAQARLTELQEKAPEITVDFPTIKDEPVASSTPKL